MKPLETSASRETFAILYLKYKSLHLINVEPKAESVQLFN